MKRLMLMGALLFLVSACGSVPLTEGGKTVNVAKSDPATSCKEIGQVSGRTDLCWMCGPDEVAEKTRNRLKNAAAVKGANYVRLEKVENINFESGTAFKCP